MIILRNNSHGGIIRVCMGIFTTALRNKKIRQILKKNTSPYFHSVSLVIWPLTLMKRTHFSCEMIILRNNSHGGIIRVCMGIFTTALRNKQNTSNSQKKNTSPYFHSVSFVIWSLTLMKRAHFSKLFISRFSTFIRNVTII